MFKKLSIIIFCIFISSSAFAQSLKVAPQLTEITIKKYNTLFNSWVPTKLSLHYIPSQNSDPAMILFIFEGDLEYITFVVFDENLSQFINILDKFLEWDDVAHKHKVTTQKEIGKFKITEIMQEMNNESHTSGMGPILSGVAAMLPVSFGGHDLKIVLPSATSMNNQFIEIQSYTLDISKKNVLNLKNALNPDHIQKVVDDFIKKRKQEEEIFK